jgi:hypothetical protein
MSKAKNGESFGSCADAGPAVPDPEYKVGPGRPPREHQFKPGQSGNPKGARRKPSPIALDFKEALERALDKAVTLKQGERERTVTMAVAGMEQLVAQYAKGDRHARRDLIALAGKLDVDLTAGRTKDIGQAIAANHEAILDAFLFRQYDKVMEREAMFAPPELLDDDPDDQSGA